MGRDAYTFFHMFILIQGLSVPTKIFLMRYIEEYLNVYRFRGQNTQRGLAFGQYTHKLDWYLPAEVSCQKGIKDKNESTGSRPL